MSCGATQLRLLAENTRFQVCPGRGLRRRLASTDDTAGPRRRRIGITGTGTA